MKEVVIDNIERTKFHGYCPNRYDICMHWEIEFPKSELEKLEPVVEKGGIVKFENEDGSVEEYNYPTMIRVKNNKFIYNNRICDIFTYIGFRTNEKGEEVCFANALFPIYPFNFDPDYSPQVSATEALEILKEENPNV